MSINACIYDSRNILAGCITDSVIERFKSEFESLKNKYFGDVVTPILGVMEKSLIQSIDKMSADFLNCLKLISRKYRDDAPIGFVQEVSRSYHNLVRYCCSQAVYDEVMQETIEQFRSAGMDYVGANSKGFEQNDCIFEYNGKKIAVRMRNKEDLYRFWDDGSKVENCATIYDGADEYVVTSNGSPMDLAEEIVSTIDEDIVDLDDEGIIESIIKVIENLVVGDDNARNASVKYEGKSELLPCVICTVSPIEFTDSRGNTQTYTKEIHVYGYKYWNGSPATINSCRISLGNGGMDLIGLGGVIQFGKDLYFQLHLKAQDLESRVNGIHNNKQVIDEAKLRDDCDHAKKDLELFKEYWKQKYNELKEAMELALRKAKEEL